MEKKVYTLQYFVEKDLENKQCIDCGGPSPSHVSINQGVFLCTSCANNHKKLGYNISYLHEISSPWDNYLLSYATLGGNSKFKRLCLKYEIPCQTIYENDEERLNKYIIKFGEYCRLLLKSEVEADEPPPPLYKEVAKDKCNLNIEYFGEFKDYKLYKGQHYVAKKKDSIGTKIWNGTKATASVVGTAGELVYKAGKPVVGFLGGAAIQGLKLVGSSLYNHCIGNNGSSNIEFNNNTYNNNHHEVNNEFEVTDYFGNTSHVINVKNLDNPSNQNNINYVNYNNIYSINNQNYQNNLDVKKNIESLNKHNNIIANDNYLINNKINMKNNNSNNSSKNIESLNLTDNFENSDSFNHPDYVRENSNGSNNLIDNNSYAGMEIQFENTDKNKARKEANNFLLQP